MGAVCIMSLDLLNSRMKHLTPGILWAGGGIPPKAKKQKSKRGKFTQQDNIRKSILYEDNL